VNREQAKLRPGAAAGDEDSIRALWHAHRRWVAAILLAHMPRDAELEDLLQDVAVQVVRNIDRLKDPAAIRPWLRTIAVNTARTAGRRREVRRRGLHLVGAGSPGRFDGAASAAEEAARREAREEGERAMALCRMLPEEYREPLMLRAVRGMSYRQIADVLGVPVTTIETRLVRGRRMLKELMERDMARRSEEAREASAAPAKGRNEP